MCCVSVLSLKLFHFVGQYTSSCDGGKVLCRAKFLFRLSLRFFGFI